MNNLIQAGQNGSLFTQDNPAGFTADPKDAGDDCEIEKGGKSLEKPTKRCLLKALVH